MKKNKGYYYKLLSDDGKYQVYEQYDDDEPMKDRFVAYEVWKNKKHWKTCKTLDRVNKNIEQNEK